ncbi:MAG TPA: cupin domain-containing protein [Candidatus Polarisedimenticolia bacterium]|nr:cupin domain-containing protein [Candidatus Polarisedimenticolia bacterium]
MARDGSAFRRLVTRARTLIALLALAAPLTAARPGAGGAAGVTHIPGAEVAEAFRKGVPLLEVDGYKVHASRRDGPGQAEVHEKDTDILYVLQGAATLVTGGRVEEAGRTAREEIRGPSIAGGVSRVVAAGDVVVVPAGVPHWFKDVRGPLTYYVVKVRS